MTHQTAATVDALTLDPSSVVAALRLLETPAEAPSLTHLNRLLHAYTRRVPWESASRIARRAMIAETAACPRWPTLFWREARTLGHGGTCFESNAALFALLTSLGYQAYLTVNDMGSQQGCHSALIVTLATRRYLVDVGLPLHVAVPLDGERRATDRFFEYRLLPNGPGRFQVERAPHPRPTAFTLIDRPVSREAYCRVVAADYGPNGYFLDKLVLTKIVGQRIWRFNSAERPLALESFARGRAFRHELDRYPAATLAVRFGIDERTLRTALALATAP